jgi:transposase-like protein
MIKNGKTKANIQRYICKLCSVTKQEEYSYNACTSFIKKALQEGKERKADILV